MTATRLLGLLALLLTGCVASPAGPDDTTIGKARRETGDTRPEEEQARALREKTKGFADGYVTLVGSACNRIIENNESIEQRRWAMRIRSLSATAIYDIATNPDPFTQLVDLVVVVSLQNSVWVDDARADDYFEDRADYLVLALRSAREEIWEIAEQTFSSEQLAVLDSLIWSWRQANPDVEFVSLVRFSDFADSRGKSVVTEAGASLSPFGTIDRVANEAKQARELAERMFYVAKRSPILLEWQIEQAQTELLAQPEIYRLLENQDTIVAAIDRISTRVDEVPAIISGEREAIMAALDERTGELKRIATLYQDLLEKGRLLNSEVNQTIASSTELVEAASMTATAIERTAIVADRLVGRFKPEAAAAGEAGPAPSDAGASGDGESSSEEGFRIEDYTEAIRELNLALQEANRLLTAADGIVADERLGRAMSRIEKSADRWEAIGFWNVVGLIAAFFGFLAAYRTYAVRLRARYGEQS